MTTKKRSKLTLRDKLSRLTFAQACKLAGDGGEALIRQGGAYDIDPVDDVQWRPGRMEVVVGSASVTFSLADGARRRMAVRCSRCTSPCDHVGAALSLVLEEKLALGLSALPVERLPLEHLTEEQLVARAIADRTERARTERMTLRSTEPGTLWTDYTITSAGSGKTYRLALRGWERGESYCSCPDFRTNTLGTCKHLIHAQRKLRRRFSAAERAGSYDRKGTSVTLRYGSTLELRLQTPRRLTAPVRRVLEPVMGRAITDVADLMRRIRRLERLDEMVVIHPDAAEYIDRQLLQRRIVAITQAMVADPTGHPLRSGLLRGELLPYQVEGIAFAAGAGRAILADDMGLGKTIQGIGVAEVLARQAGIERVLVVCPTSLKAQWRNEIARFCDRDCQLVLGRADERASQYDSGTFFTVCNYEQVLRDILAIEATSWDLIVLDEAQRIKNWEAKTSRIIKGLRSTFALALTGTPLENRLEELFSVVGFSDNRHLGPAFRFIHSHRVVDERGRVLGYRNLAELRQRLEPVLLRRTRTEVLGQLPPRTTEMVRIAPTEEQLELHDAHLRIVSTIARKPYLTEMDLLRLRKALLMCRLAANDTFLVDKQEPGYSSKLGRLADLIERLGAEPDRKAVLFSEWTTMLDRIEPLLQRQGLDYVRLDGSVPQKLRQQLVDRFRNGPDCRLFLATNAGSTGLNLQCADTVINVDLPWNPAVLEQRIGRVHRMGQRRPVHVFVLVTEDTLEDRLLGTLAAKHDLALAALDRDSEVDEVAIASGMDELKRRLEVLLGAKPEAPVDVSQKRQAEAEVAGRARAERVASAAGDLLRSAFALVGELLPDSPEAAPTRQLAEALTRSTVEPIEADAAGNLKLTLTLPAAAALASGGPNTTAS